MLFAEARSRQSSPPMLGSSETHAILQTHAGRRERKSWKREEEEADEPRCCLPEHARVDPRRLCLGLATRPTVGLSRPRRGFGKTHSVGFARPRQDCFGLSLCGLICYFCLSLIFCNW
jgi:hypothetical protein